MNYTPADKSAQNNQKQALTNEYPGKSGIPDNRQTPAGRLAQLMASSERHENNRHLVQKMAMHSQRQKTPNNNSGTIQRAPISSSNKPIQLVLTRSMQKIIDETEFKSSEDMVNFYQWLLLKYPDNTALAQTIVGGVLDRQRSQEPTSAFKEITGSASSEVNESDEESVNIVDHGGLLEYDDTSFIDQYVSTYQVAQLARKGNTISGPKSYTTSGGAAFNQVAYQTDGKGCINFSACHSQQSWSDPVLAGSEVDLSKSNQTIDTKNRAQHFAIGDFLYAKMKGFNKASDTTNMRKSKWTWHHLPTPYKMVLVDMTVHAKHGHNGGVYLW